MRIEGGCATVSGYELPKPLLKDGKAGVRNEARSQDTGSSVLVVTGGAEASLVDFSVKEKDEARIPPVRGIAVEPSFPVLRRVKDFFSPLPHWSLVLNRAQAQQKDQSINES